MRKKHDTEPGLPFDAPSSPPDATAPTPPAPTMFGITPDDLEPIEAIARALDPDADMSRLGAWGILFFVCGAIAGQSLSWKAQVFENIRVPGPAEYVKFLQTGQPDEEGYGMTFSKIVKKWYQDETGQALAKRNMQALPDMSEETRVKLRHYFGLAILLNSMADYESAEFTPVKQWAAQSPTGWQTLFFAAGLLLSSDKDVRWEHMRAAIVAGSEGRREQVQGLFTSFEPGRGRHRAERDGAL